MLCPHIVVDTLHLVDLIDRQGEEVNLCCRVGRSTVDRRGGLCVDSALGTYLEIQTQGRSTGPEKKLLSLIAGIELRTLILLLGRSGSKV